MAPAPKSQGGRSFKAAQHLTMACSETAPRLCGRERVAELCRFLLQVVPLALAEPLVILRRPDVVGGDPLFAHVIHGASDLVRRGHQGLCGTKSSFQAPIEGAKRTVRAADRRRRHAAGWRGTVAMLHGAALEPCAAGEVMLGGHAQPGAAGCVIRPLAPIRADLAATHGLRQRSAEAVPGHEVHPGDAEDVRAGVDRRGVLAVRMGLATRWRGSPAGRGAAGPGSQRGGMTQRRVRSGRRTRGAGPWSNRTRPAPACRTKRGASRHVPVRARAISSAACVPREWRTAARGCGARAARDDGPENPPAGGARDIAAARATTGGASATGPVCMGRTCGARCARSWARWRSSVRSATQSASGRNEAASTP